MKTQSNEAVSRTSPVGLVVHTGTSAIKVAIGMRKLEHKDGLVSPEEKVRIVGVDAPGVISTFPAQMLEPNMGEMTLGAGEFVPAAFPDPESLEKAERNGTLWPMDSGWHKNPGTSKDNLLLCKSLIYRLLLVSNGHLLRQKSSTCISRASFSCL